MNHPQYWQQLLGGRVDGGADLREWSRVRFWGGVWIAGCAWSVFVTLRYILHLEKALFSIVISFTNEIDLCYFRQSPEYANQPSKSYGEGSSLNSLILLICG